MNGDVAAVTTWGADFWQKVLISGLGTLGSLLVALFIFGLTRWRDRARVQDERRIATLTQFSESIGEVLQAFMNSTVTPAVEESLRSAAVNWMSKSISFRVALGMSPIREDFERTSNLMGAWLRGSNAAFVRVRVGTTSLEDFSRSIGLVAEQLLLLQHEVNVLIVREALGNREARRVENQRPALDK